MSSALDYPSRNGQLFPLSSQHFSVQKFVFVQIKINTLKFIQRLLFQVAFSPWQHLSVNCEFPFLLSCSLSSFPSWFPPFMTGSHIVPCGLELTVCPEVLLPALLECGGYKVSYQACLYEGWEKDPRAWKESEARTPPPQPKLDISWEWLVLFYTFVSSFSGEVILT